MPRPSTARTTSDQVRLDAGDKALIMMIAALENHSFNNAVEGAVQTFLLDYPPKGGQITKRGYPNPTTNRLQRSAFRGTRAGRSVPSAATSAKRSTTSLPEGARGRTVRARYIMSILRKEFGQ